MYTSVCFTHLCSIGYMHVRTTFPHLYVLYQHLHLTCIYTFLHIPTHLCAICFTYLRLHICIYVPIPTTPVLKHLFSHCLSHLYVLCRHLHLTRIYTSVHMSTHLCAICFTYLHLQVCIYASIPTRPVLKHLFAHYLTHLYTCSFTS